jgi:hypothetical protein
MTCGTGRLARLPPHLGCLRFRSHGRLFPITVSLRIDPWWSSYCLDAYIDTCTVYRRGMSDESASKLQERYSAGALPIRNK